MYKKIFQTILLTVAFTTFVQAQTKGKQGSKTETDTASTNKQNDNELTLTIQGDTILVNGVLLEYTTDKNIKIIEGKNGRKYSLREYLKNNNAPHFFDNKYWDFAGIDNKAELGIFEKNTEDGGKLITVYKGSAAKKAGLQQGDIITKVDDIKIDKTNTIDRVIHKYNPGDKITITYKRNDTIYTTQAVLDKSKTFSVGGRGWWNNTYDNGLESTDGNFFFNAYPRTPKIGLEIQDVEEGNGVKVLAVTEQAPASKSGLRTDDIITEIDGTDLKDVDNFKMKLRGIKEGDTLKLKYKRENKFYNTEIKLPKKLKKASL
ncbi:MAG: PDZ domain-containing protein [Chitinophagaceae bacterium]|nr:PDZ domain-containing protein [Chitinophagaceae bacterium]